MKKRINRDLAIIIVLPILVILIGVFVNSNRSDSAGLATIHGIEYDKANKMLFQTADNCMSCHNNLVTPAGEDVSIGIDWQTSMMANSARDPYWQAAVRREVMDHPGSQKNIENECSTCHMPMSHYQANASGKLGQVFTNLPVDEAVSQQHLLAADGVSCTTCHQIRDENLGEPESFVGGFVIDTTKEMGNRDIFGPYPVDDGRSVIMHSYSGFRQMESKHLIQSEVCATCHTLYTHTLGPDGEVIGELPEQVPYLEWQHSSFVDDQSCQSCHMPVVEDSMAITSVWGQPRADFSRHSFRGANFFMQRMLNRYRDELGVQAPPQDMDAAINRTVNHLQTKSAQIYIENTEITEDEVIVRIALKNLAGHKLPTAYPSRRAWVHFTIYDNMNNKIFESGAVRSDGSITGNDNDISGDTYEKHYNEISSGDQVQIYEAILADQHGEITTGLLTGIRFIKDNRVLPDGFDKTTADEDFAVQGLAYQDMDFTGGSDRLLYRVNHSGAERPLRITAELKFQPIAFRWAQNLSSYDSNETNRFVGYFNSMSDDSHVTLATTSAIIN